MSPATNGVKVELGRRYRFAASHRLHSDRLSESENVRLYGKCNNPHGHGHNYVVEIAVSGGVDPATGMIANLADLDGFVEREVRPFLTARILSVPLRWPALQRHRSGLARSTSRIKLLYN